MQGSLGNEEPFFFEMKNKINKPCCDNVYRLVKDKGGLSSETNPCNNFSKALPKKIR